MLKNITTLDILDPQYTDLVLLLIVEIQRLDGTPEITSNIKLNMDNNNDQGQNGLYLIIAIYI